ncbi:MAG: type II secretion system protein [Candidatus Buchananbacteria bacterium]|nr:type II secretion system protein [Candidatus Buchananbacteria bacterium]
MTFRGFTLIEMLITVGIILVVAGLSIPFLFSYSVSGDVTTYANDIERTLRRAQLQSINGYTGMPWGVYFDEAQNKMVIFQGSEYVSRDPHYDQEITYSPALNVVPTFGAEIYFSVYSGTPSATGTVTVTSTEALFIKTIKINELGIIDAPN